MFDYLKGFEKIVVTGPSRSGTRITAKIIAYETGFLYVDEGWFGSSDETKFYQFLNMDEKMVIQAPNMSPIIHTLGNKDSLAVVLVKRDLEDIIASEINLVRYGTRGKYISYSRDMLYRYGKTEGISCEVVYNAWNEYQREQIKHRFEITYDSLKDHPMFIKREDRRKHFRHSGQTTIGDEEDKYFIENTNKVAYRWTPSFEGEKIAI